MTEKSERYILCAADREDGVTGMETKAVHNVRRVEYEADTSSSNARNKRDYKEREICVCWFQRRPSVQVSVCLSVYSLTCLISETTNS
jgi:ribonuclease PH